MKTLYQNSKGFFVICACLFVTINLQAQKYGWAKHFSPPNPVDPTILIANEGKAITRDASGNLYLTGAFAGTVDFDPGSGSFNLSTALPTLQNQFVSKLSAEGDLIWAVNIGGSAGGSNVYANAIAIGTDGAVYTTGYFTGTVDFDPGAAVANITTTSPGNVFISKLNADGSYAWTKVLTGTSNLDNGYGIAVDDANNVYAVGEYIGTIDVDPGTAVVNLSAQNQNSDGFVVKLNAAGNYVGSHNVSTGGLDMITAAVLKNGLLYTTTWMNITAAITKYDLNLNVIWEARTQGGNAWPRALTVDDAGNTIMSGSFSSPVDFDPGPGQFIKAPVGSADRFVSKLDRNGNFEWVISTALINYNAGISSDRNGDIYFINSGNHLVNITKLNYKGNTQWTATMNSPNSFVGDGIVADDNGNIYTTGYYFGNADFDPDPNITHTLTTSTGGTACFISKISNSNHISGKTFIDTNNDGIQQPNENPFPYRFIDAQYGTINYRGYSSTDGSYDIYTDTGTYTITIPYIPPYYTSTVASHTATFASATGGIDSLNNFPVYPMPNVNDLSVNVVSNERLRPGRDFYATVTYSNTGTTTLSGNVTLRHGTQIVYQQSSPAPATYTNPLLTWNFVNLQPFETKRIVVKFSVPSNVTFGTIVNQLATINPIVNDSTPLNNKDSVNEVVGGSFDPNDKSVLPAGGISTTFLCAADNYLNYTVRFQNTGNDTAFLVIVSDTIQNTLDLNSLQITGASHPFSVRIDEGKTIKFIFKNILLVDSTTNEPLSHGFIAYKIKPLSNLSVGTSVKNMASIFFDFNSAVLTNQTDNPVTAMQPPAVNISASTTTTCAGSPITFTATATNGGTAPAYQWQVNGVNAGTNNALFTTSTLNNGDQVSCIMTSNASCVTTPTAASNIIAVAITASVVPAVSINTPSANICTGSTVTFNAVPTNEGPAGNYQWQVNGVNAGTNSNSFTTSTLTNNAQVKVILTSSLSCALPATATSNIITMAVTAIPVANAGNDIAICAGGSTQLNGSGGTSYSWTPAAGLSNASIANPIASPAATTSYVLTVNNGANCFSKDTILITVTPVAPAPSINISAPVTTICSGSPVMFTATATNGGSSPVYQWQVNAVNTGSNNNIFTSSVLNNNDQVKVILTSNSSCILSNTATSNIITMVVQQVAIPTIALNSMVYTVTNPDIAASYTWQIKNNNIWVDVLPIATGITYTATVTGEYRVKAIKGVCTIYSASQSTNLITRLPSNNPFGIYLYPNPSNRIITIDSIKISQNWETLDIIAADGKHVSSTYNIKLLRSVSINVSALKNGTYFVQLRKKDGEYTSIPFIKQ